MIQAAMENRIFFNGKEYRNVEEMPPEIRRAYEAVMGVFADRDANGLPDLLEGSHNSVSGHQMNLVHDGMVYHSLEDLPPEARAKYQAAMQKLDHDGNGIPDFVETLAGRFAEAARHENPSQPEQDSPPPASTARSSPVMEEVGINWTVTIIALVIVIIIILAAAAGWLLLAR